MRVLGRMAFSFSALVVWIVAVVLGLEVYHAFRWRAIERSNPYVLAKHGQARWPGEQPSNENVRAQAVTETTLLLPEPDPLAEGIRRAAFFEDLDEENRALFAGLYGMSVLVVDDALRPTAAYGLGPGANARPNRPRYSRQDAGAPIGTGFTLEHFCGLEYAADCRSWVRRVFATGLPERNALASGAILVCPERGVSGTVEAVYLFREEPAVVISSGPLHAMWEKPFFRYKNHATDPDPTNNYGFRDGEIAVPKPPGVFRILCVGGSTTEEGETNETSYPNLLEARLNAHFPGHMIDVVNCGITGLNTVKEKMRLPDYFALGPDLLVLYNGVNDLCHERFPRWVHAVSGLKKLVRRSRFLNYHANAWLLPSEESMAEDLDATVLENLRFICAYAKARNVDVALCSFASPSLESLPREAREYYDYVCQQEWGGRYVTFASYCQALRLLNTQIKALGEETGALYIPLAEELRGGPEYFGDICHLRNAGIERKAEVVFEHLTPYLESRLFPMTNDE